MIKYKLVKDNLPAFTGHAKLFELSKPIPYADGKETKFVIASKANAMFSGWETYLFPADADGRVIDWGELEGSRRGVCSHESCMDELVARERE